ncbi:MAG: M20/M25/M40 family metallo-hydrolase, partial [Phycisphaerae bacterium]|nr:M20/M25/M40 family metallo-hydrolase [Phycisphaerae bacterium]
MTAIDYLRSHRSESLERLRSVLRVPSISANPANAGDCRKVATMVVDYMRSFGLRSEVAQTGGSPAAVGFWDGAGPDAPTVLLYGHYDVQPPDPLELWSCDPFAAEVRSVDVAGKPAPEGGVLVARGAADDKGQFMALLAGVEAIMATAGKLPVNLKVVIEGEEEVGSPNLAAFIRGRKDEFAADVVLLADGELDPRGRPTIVSS